MAETSTPEGYPAWFDSARHVIGQGGIFEADTGVLLGEDGEPASAAVRAARAADAPASEPPKRRRSTMTVIAEHAAVTAADAE
jgi:hypothetical protein